ncbi:hypothetical protein OE88DRAFT_404491 [Heliocybe sulcata]|uniref:Uncharacterized protein n=1 Tax=Heliocybe sulcata TaxID=5364 RepID=A0A5C3MVU7_9AGAM|nr:hypothetical protein OE88DRAFT_404491 [Heliocybe sulcata]
MAGRVWRYRCRLPGLFDSRSLIHLDRGLRSLSSARASKRSKRCRNEISKNSSQSFYTNLLLSLPPATASGLLLHRPRLTPLGQAMLPPLHSILLLSCFLSRGTLQAKLRWVSSGRSLIIHDLLCTYLPVECALEDSA